MKNFRKKQIITSCVIIALAVITTPFIITKNTAAVKMLPEKTSPLPLKTTKGYHDQSSSEDMEKDLRNDFYKGTAASFLQDTYAGNIHHPRIQVEVIEEVVRFLKRKYQDRWSDHIYSYLETAFPEFADEIYNRFLNLEEYKTWLNDNYALLVDMSPEERREMLWEKRHFFFGEEALEIWSREFKNQTIQAALEEIDLLEGKTFDEKLDYYTTEINDACGADAETYIQRHQQELMDNFLGLDSVQNHLHQMTPDERKTCLRNVRVCMGLDDDALARWDKLDQKRDERWNSGTDYMRERQILTTEYKGSVLEQKLDDLRNQHFTSMADTIKNEEEVGFFRFNRKRVYGKN